MGKITCGPCGKVFKTNAEYLKHKCEKAGGAKPTEPEYLIRTTTPHFAKISEAAVKRGAEKKAKK